MCGCLHVQNTSILGQMVLRRPVLSSFQVIIARAILVFWCYSTSSNTSSHTFQLFSSFLSFFFFFSISVVLSWWLCSLATRLFIYFTVLDQMPINQVLILAAGITWKAVFSFVPQMGRFSWAKTHLWRSGASLHDKGPPWLAEWYYGLVPKQPVPQDPV